MARDSLTRFRHVRRVPGISAPCAFCAQHVSPTATAFSYQTLSFALAQMARCRRDVLPSFTAAYGNRGVAIGARFGLETRNVQRRACAHATSGAARLAAYGALEYVVFRKVHSGEEIMRRTYAVTVVLQIEEPEAFGSPGALQDAVSKKFVVQAIPIRLRDAFSSPVDFALTGVVVTDCAQVLP